MSASLAKQLILLWLIIATIVPTAGNITTCIYGSYGYDPILITDIRAPTPFTQLIGYTILNPCSDTYTRYTTLFAIVSATNTYTAPVQVQEIGPLVPTSLYTLTYVFTDLIMTDLHPGDLLIMLESVYAYVDGTSGTPYTSTLICGVALNALAIPSTTSTISSTSTSTTSSTSSTSSSAPTTVTVTTSAMPTSSDDNTKTIVGGVVGGVLGLVLIAALFYLLIMPRRHKFAIEDDPPSNVFAPVETNNTNPEALRYPEDLEVNSGRVKTG